MSARAPLLLLHGFAGDTADWNGVRAGLRGERRVLAEPLWGHRGHPESAEGAGFAHEVDRLAERVHLAKLEDAQLVGYSLGARLALGMLVRHPRLFSGATLIGVQTGLSPAQRVERLRADAAWIELLGAEPLEVFYERWLAQPLLATQARFPEATRERVRRLCREHDRRGLAQALQVLGLGSMPDYRDRLASIPVPVRLVHGALDAKFGAIGAEILPAFRQAALHALPDCGHNPLLESPAQLAALLELSPTIQGPQ